MTGADNGGASGCCGGDGNILEFDWRIGEVKIGQSDGSKWYINYNIFNPQAILNVYQLFYFRGTVYFSINGLMTDGRTPH